MCSVGKMMYPEVSFKTADINDFHYGQYDVIICTLVNILVMKH